MPAMTALENATHAISIALECCGDLHSEAEKLKYSMQQRLPKIASSKKIGRDKIKPEVMNIIKILFADSADWKSLA